MKPSILLAAAVVLNAGSSVLYKYSSLSSSNRGLSALLLAMGLGLGAANAALYAASLKGMKLNVAYPVFSAGSLVLVTALSLAVFGEGLSARKIAGIATLALGAALVST